MNIKPYRSYKFLDRKGRRLSIFATETKDGSSLEIFVLTCSKQDQFSKAFAKIKYNKYLGGIATNTKHIVATIPIVDTKPGQTFIKYCYANYGYKVTYKVNKNVVGLVFNSKVRKPNKIEDTQ